MRSDFSFLSYSCLTLCHNSNYTLFRSTSGKCYNCFVEYRLGRNSKQNEPNKPRLGRGRTFAISVGMRAVALLACPGDDIAFASVLGSQTMQNENPAILNESPKTSRVERAVPMGK